MTTATQILQQMEATFADLPPAPMNGATLLEVSLGDYAKMVARATVPLSADLDLCRLRIRRNDVLPDGSLIGRKDGKAVWSNNAALQALIDSGGLDGNRP